MAKSFKQLKSPLLGLQDKLQVGKLSGCRICDVVDDEYDYLIWLEKSGYVKYAPETIKKIQEVAGFRAEQVHYENEIEPWLDQDVPF